MNSATRHMPRRPRISVTGSEVLSKLLGFEFENEALQCGQRRCQGLVFQCRASLPQTQLSDVPEKRLRKRRYHLCIEVSVEWHIETAVAEFGEYGQDFESNLAAGLHERKLLAVTILLFRAAFECGYCPRLSPLRNTSQRLVGTDLDGDLFVNAELIDPILDLAREGQEVRGHLKALVSPAGITCGPF